MSTYEAALNKREKEVEWSKDCCDKYDYLIAVSCGVLGGLVDIFFVGSATTKVSELSALGKCQIK